MNLKIYYYKSPIGCIEIQGDNAGIQSILFKEDLPKLVDNTVPKELKSCVKQLQEYFDKERNEFDLSLNPQGTDFQKKVWNCLADIPFGKTITYKKQAQTMGNELVIRAMASANGKNPLSIVVPCHRVIGSDGSLTGYAGGLWRKKWLLEHEGSIKQTSLF